MRAGERWLWCTVGLAFMLRLPRAVSRWDEIALAYAAYWEPTARSLSDFDLGTALTGWTGLHPPLYGLILGSLENLLPIPMVFLLLSVCLSTFAVYCTGRVAGALGALVLATSPLQLSYAAELNNYPLGVAAVALCLLVAQENWRWTAGAAIVAAWTHVLAAFGALGLVAYRVVRDRRGRQSSKLLAMTFLGMLPVGVGALRLLGEGGTFGQEGDAIGWLSRAMDAVGTEGVILSFVAFLAWRHPAAWVWAAMVGVLGTTLGLGISSAEQLQYLPLLGPPVAVMIGVGVSSLREPNWHRWVVALVVVGCLVRGSRFMVAEVERVREIVADQESERSIDVAVASSRPGDTVWMVAPANQMDDDKTATAPALWRISPLSFMPLARPVEFEYRDYRYGQPREWQGRVLHSSTELYAAPFDSVALATLEGGGEVWVVLYEHGHAEGLVSRIERTLRPYDVDVQEIPRGEHPERLYRVKGLRAEDSTE